MKNPVLFALLGEVILVKTLEQIKQDLETVKRYYAHKDEFEQAFQSGKCLQIQKLVNEYEEAILLAPSKFYDVYCAIYQRGLTQEACAIELGYTSRYIQSLLKLMTFHLLNTF